MISYPMPEFEQQKSEVLQRFNILSKTSVADTNETARMVSLAMNTPMVMVSLNQRYRDWFQAHIGIASDALEVVENFCSLAQLSQSTFIVENVRKEPYFANELAVKKAPGIGFFAGTPLHNPHGQRFGTLCILDTKQKIMSERERSLFASIGLVVSNDICLRSAGRYAVRDLIDAERDKCDLYNLATTDELSSALNRRSFFYLAERERRRRRRHNTSLSVIMLDIDHFKQVNDIYGHAVGDVVIQMLSETVSNIIRDDDIFGRLGGEEFALVLPDTDKDGAAVLAERIRTAIEVTVFEADGKQLKITISLGIGEPDVDENSISEALDRADQALYEAKNTGRNKVVISSRGTCYEH